MLFLTLVSTEYSGCMTVNSEYPVVGAEYQNSMHSCSREYLTIAKGIALLLPSSTALLTDMS